MTKTKKRRNDQALASKAKCSKISIADSIEQSSECFPDSVPTTPIPNNLNSSLYLNEVYETLATPQSISIENDTHSILTKKRPSGEPLLLTQYDAVKDHLSLFDLQQLVLWCFHENGINPKHFLVKNRHSVERIVVLHVPGLHPSMLLSSDVNLKDFKQPLPLNEVGLPITSFLKEPNSDKLIFSHLFPLIGQGGKSHIDDVTLSFLNKLPKDVKNQFFPKDESPQKQDVNENNSVEVHRPSSSHVEIPSSLLLSKSVMLENNIPLHPFLSEDEEQTFPNGWVHSNVTSLQMDNKHWKLLSIDCEMCETKNGSELTRVSILAHNGDVLLNEFVKPDYPILDYRTFYSGITSVHLENVETRLTDIQRKLLDIVDENCVLVGHSVENDLRALQFTHPYILDTSILYARGPNMKHRLRFLSKRYLQREIQCPYTSVGHCSLEDAKATLDLVLLKIKTEDKPEGKKDDSSSTNPTLLNFLKMSLVPKTTIYISHKEGENNSLINADHHLSYSSIDDFLPTFQQALVLDNLFVYSELPFLKDISPSHLEDEGRQRLASLLQLIAHVFEQLPKRTLFLVFSASTHLPLLESKKLEFSKSTCAQKNAMLPSLHNLVRKAKQGCALVRLKSFS